MSRLVKNAQQTNCNEIFCHVNIFLDFLTILFNFLNLHYKKTYIPKTKLPILKLFRVSKN